MKNVVVLFLLTACFFRVHAADTTTVTTHNKVVIKTNPAVGVTEYPATGYFPDSGTQYRKVYLYMEFGCAPGLNCGEWDYTNHIYLEKYNTRFEIARFITPYGKYWNSSMNWKHGWIYDVTDFSYLLHDSCKIIYQHSGYEANTDRGWTVTLNFNAVKGEPARLPVGISTIYGSGASYGNDNNPFENVIVPKTFTMPDSADMVSFKTQQTGHGMDQQENCSEFCSKQRIIYLDQQEISKQQVWRDNCGMNSLYPQAGTWLYDRAGWCPGAPVIPFDQFKMLKGGSTHSYHLTMQQYSNTKGGSAYYDITTYALYFKDNRKQTDAAVEDIIAPSKHYDYLRYNPICGAPLIKVHNYGRDTIKRLDFEYGKLGGKTQKIWVPCNIAPFENGIVELEAIYDWSGSGNKFFATITKVNDMADEYTEDNTAYSDIVRSPTHPNKIIITYKTNNAPSENSYTLKDSRGNLIAQRGNFQATTVYRDTIELGNNICYTFDFSDEGTPPSNNPLNKDGLDWWANTADGTGYLQFRNGYTNGVIKSFNADFGTKVLYNFMTTFNMGIDEINSNENLQVDVYPNPAAGNSHLHIESLNGSVYSYSIYDATGKLISSNPSAEGVTDAAIEGLAPGVYTVVVYQDGRAVSSRFVIQ